jgi:hypothetical protein
MKRIMCFKDTTKQANGNIFPWLFSLFPEMQIRIYAFKKSAAAAKVSGFPQSNQ